MKFSLENGNKALYRRLLNNVILFSKYELIKLKI